MGRIVFDTSMSLDGFMTAANVRPAEPLGDGGERLHEWAMEPDERNRAFLERAIGGAGAVIAGRRTYDASLPWWGADGPTGSRRLPVFVVTTPRRPSRRTGASTRSRPTASRAPCGRRGRRPARGASR
jgi:dihydrofolate reductase